MRSTGWGKGDKGKATRMHSLIVRARGVCARCGERDYSKLQCAHAIPRRYSATRTNTDAAWALCASCHLRTTEHADEHMALVDATIGRAEFDRLKEAAMTPTKMDWKGEVERLTEIARSLGVA